MLKHLIQLKPAEAGIEQRSLREAELWSIPRTLTEMRNVREYIINEARRLPPTDWGVYALRFVCGHSPQLADLMSNGEINIDLIQSEELKGIRDTVELIRAVDIISQASLRSYFCMMFKVVSRQMSEEPGTSRFYNFGRNRVLDALRTYRASTRSFVPNDKKIYDLGGLELETEATINKEVTRMIQKALSPFDAASEQRDEIKDTLTLREKFRFKIDTNYPYLEFNLDAIANADNFKYKGALVNALFDHLNHLLKVVRDYEWLEYRAVTSPLWDGYADIFAVEGGIVMMVKYKGAVDYYPDRLWIEFQDIPDDSWVIKWLKSYKLFLEGND